MSKYVQRYDEEGFEVPSSTLYKIACCDCGLVHDFVFVSNDGLPIGIAARRNNRATAQRRRNLKLRGINMGMTKEQAENNVIEGLTFLIKYHSKIVSDQQRHPYADADSSDDIIRVGKETVSALRNTRSGLEDLFTGIL